MLFMMSSFHKHLAILFLVIFTSVECYNDADLYNTTYSELITDGNYSKPACVPGEFFCFNGKCVGLENVCNGRNDCGDWSDENFCGSYCGRGKFRCKDNSGCFSVSYLCDGREHCNDGSDESDCRVIARYNCRPGMFLCKSGFCIHTRSVCNGLHDCTDGDDELNCGTRNMCPLGRFACKDGSRCISSFHVCDGYNDCRDMSDEENCRITSTATPGCPQRQFTCWDGRCINFNWVCDGYNDCLDGSDEMRCGSHLTAGGVIGIIIACSVLITVIVIALICMRKWKQERSTGTVLNSQPLPAGFPPQQLPQVFQTTPIQQRATTASEITQQHGNCVHDVPQTETKNQQPQSNLYPSLPQQTLPAAPQNSTS